jgi:hypothetical protein
MAWEEPSHEKMSVKNFVGLSLLVCVNKYVAKYTSNLSLRTLHMI